MTKIKLHTTFKQKFIFIFSMFFLTSMLFPFGGNIKAEEVNIKNEIYVIDQANLLDEETKETIILENLKYEATKEKPQISVVTVNSIGNDSLINYSYNLFQKMKLGNSEYNNGLLFLYVKDTKSIRVDVGYGLEGALPDGKVGRILDTNLEGLKSNNPNDAILNTFMTFVQEVNYEYGYENLADNYPIDNEEKGSAIFVFILILLLFLFPPTRQIMLQILFYSSFGGGSGRDYGGGSYGGGYGGSFGGGGSSGGGGASR